MLLHPDSEYSASDLSRLLQVPITTAHRETQRLLKAGIFSARQVGRAKLLKANRDNKAVRPLTELLTLSLGPHVVVTEEFAPIPGSDRILIFGSWARRYAGEPGAPPNDIDVLVVGDVDRADVYEAADAAARRLDMPVNPTVAPQKRWRSASDPMIQSINASPVVLIKGEKEGETSDPVGNW